tara:strand:+ start:1126 stop:1359 length:234 start_codon:yes stop_codon:yes gene_type:complete
MINEVLYMNGYGLYVWSSFIFTLSCFWILYSVIKYQLIKEQKKFILRFESLQPEKAEIVKKQKIFKEILATSSVSKI